MKKKTFTAISLIFAIIFSTASCNTDVSKKSSANKKIRIAISKQKSNRSTTKYINWLLRNNKNVECFNLYPLGIDSALELLGTCNGLLLTGGVDVFPGYYGKISDTSRCGTFDRYRDSLEFALIDRAIKNKMPIFGVCRGEQILNISQGGTLYIDIPTDFDTLVKHRNADWSRAEHSVKLVDSTMLSSICKPAVEGIVVTSHHQGIEKIAPNLIISAYAPDSLPEGIEWKDKTGKGFLMAVQWHPEAMDSLHPLSAPLAKKFLSAAKDYNPVSN